jgi:hypothetical protein
MARAAVLPPPLPPLPPLDAAAAACSAAALSPLPPLAVLKLLPVEGGRAREWLHLTATMMP